LSLRGACKGDEAISLSFVIARRPTGRHGNLSPICHCEEPVRATKQSLIHLSLRGAPWGDEAISYTRDRLLRCARNDPLTCHCEEPIRSTKQSLTHLSLRGAPWGDEAISHPFVIARSPIGRRGNLSPICHCEEPIRATKQSLTQATDCFASLAMTPSPVIARSPIEATKQSHTQATVCFTSFAMTLVTRGRWLYCVRLQLLK